MDISFDLNNSLHSITSNIFTSKITIATQKRNGKKCITILYGLDQDIDLKKILKYLKKKFNCNGSIENDENFGEIIQVSGDKKKEIFDFLVKEEICKEDDIIVKGE